MPIPTAQLLAWSRVVANRWVAVTNEFVPGGLEDLSSFTQEEVKEAVKSFRTHTTAVQRFLAYPHSLQTGSCSYYFG
jgi:hypothetical protein